MGLIYARFLKHAGEANLLLSSQMLTDLDWLLRKLDFRPPLDLGDYLFCAKSSSSFSCWFVSWLQERKLGEFFLRSSTITSLLS